MTDNILALVRLGFLRVVLSGVGGEWEGSLNLTLLQISRRTNIISI